LVRKARRGDAVAFEGLVRRHYRAAYSVALAILGSAMDAEDVCQDSFVRALERLEDCRNPGRFVAWLMQIVRNRARNYIDYRRVRETVDLDVVAASGGDRTDDGVEQGELRETLQQALAELTELQRQVVLLHDLEGWKHREIAESLDVSEVASRQHLLNARRRLRELLGRELLEEYKNG
jgi:RNA polymerase sigma-70 factor (ECF subfamily)